MSDSVQPHRRKSTRFLHAWDSPGKNTGVGCHFLLQCMKVKSQSEVAQSCLTLCNPMDGSLPGSSIHGIFQARVLEWGATALAFQTDHLVTTFSSARMSVFLVSSIQQLMGATVSVLHFLFRYMECKIPSQSVLWSHRLLIHTYFSIPTESKWPLSHFCCLSMSIFF